MSSEILRRRAMLQAKIDEYEGVVFGFHCNKGSSSSFSFDTITDVMAITPAVDIPSNCTSLTLCYKLRGYGTFIGAKVSNDSSVNQYNYTTNQKRTVTHSAGLYKTISMTINLDEIDDCYIKDNTNNQYLWKGKNVT